MRKFLSLLLALVMVLSLGTVALAEESGDITVLYTNDVHTYIDEDLTYSTVAAYKDTFTNVLLVDAGDHIQGTAYGSMDKGASVVKIMEAADYDLATLGNHEFDYGMARALEVATTGKVPYVSCNFYNEKDGVAGENVLDSYKVFTVAGKKIAFIGITTPESFTKSTPSYFQDANGNYIYGIAGGEDGTALYAAVQTAVDAASKEADYVIALGHLGDDPASDPWNSEDVIANVTGLDAFIDGHSHSTVEMKEVKDKTGETVVLTQTGSYLDALGQMTITAAGKITTKLLSADSDELKNVTPDAEVKALEDAWKEDVTAKLDVKIGSIADTLSNYTADGTRLVRKQETNTGDFCADALYYLFDNMGLDVDCAIMNGGGIRNKATTGDITYLTCKEIHTFGNVACLITITGQQLLDALEWGAKNATNDGSAENGGFLQVSGITYQINTNIPSTVQQDEKGVWIGGPTGAYRVSNVTVGGKALDLTAKYNLAGYNYTLRDLGDGYAMFDGAVNVLDYVMEDYMVVANYVKSFKDGKVTGYSQSAGRITFYTPFEDVSYTNWAYPYVVGLYNQGIINGMTTNTYAPDTTLTLGQSLKTVLVATGALKSEDAVGEKWLENTMATAAALGFVEAGTDGTAPVSRLQFCTVAAKVCGLTASTTESQFTDCTDANVMALVDAGVINGMGDGTFAPDATLTRAQMAKIVYKIAELLTAAE